ncbi:MAG: cupin domain-containing protein [Deltaproteobacteria bacterium]|nr:cupin domain-containing protein [Deltaproteobacteria bacterium]
MADQEKIAGITIARNKNIDESSAPSRGKWSSPFHLRAGGLSIGLMRVNKDGGENNLHAHPDVDSIWVVVKGKARFYGMNDVLVAELGPGEGVSIPKGVPYWFENKEEEPMELYHITARDASVKDVHRVNFAPYTDSQKARGPRPGRQATPEEKEAAEKL